MTMSRHNYTYSTATPSRHVTTHGTSSAFSSSANPDEDWTKISDLAERRRIQNRIAQRNYRKKLKRRLEDLERRAGSSVSPPPQSQIHAEAHPDAHQQYKKSPDHNHRQISPRMLPSQFTPPMHSDDEVIFSNGCERDGSRTPPLFAYHTYPAPEEVVYPPYSHTQPYRAVSSSERNESYEYLAPVPVTLPSMMHFNEAIKCEGEDTISPYSMSFHGPSAMDIHGSHGYGDSSNPHTPPLSHSYNHSASCSESGYQYPTTPLSMPASPRLMAQV